MRERAVLLFFSLLVAATLFAQNGSIAGTIVDDQGAAIHNASVMIHWDPSGSSTGLKDNLGIKEDLHTTSDGMGHVSIEIPPGFYDVFVSWHAFTPACLKIRVKTAKSATFKVRLKPDRLVTAEIADDFSYLK